ncbi:uncharacterized protein LOC124161444 [Ischnura elegans]|uniref:uncharacterized protein LOC124161444 n=1 Tax=Ischnura elegans TaxID=197161 RepID=UPI001ED88523|nr:uncharacterized protein LOC124161444 [Ischnura elegans]
MATPPTDAESALQVNRVSMKLPPFWPDRPALWFAQLEIQFTLAGITSDKTMFMYAVAQLDNKYAIEVEDVITSPPETGRYAKLKDEILHRLSASRETRLRQLVEHEELGDRKPSQLLRHLRTLAGESVPDEFIRSLWMSRLPPSTQTILATQDSVELSSVANLADKIHEVGPRPHVASASMTPEVEALTRRMEELARQVSSLSQALGSANTSTRRPRSRSRSRGNHQRNRSQSAPRNPTWCWYHDTFGARASKCREPCTYAAENAEGSR